MEALCKLCISTVSYTAVCYNTQLPLMCEKMGGKCKKMLRKSRKTVSADTRFRGSGNPDNQNFDN